MLPSVLFVGVFYVVALLLDTYPVEPLPYREGQYLPSDIFARVTFRVLSPKRLETYVTRQKDSTAPIFRLNSSLSDEIVTSLKSLPKRLKTTTRPADIDEHLRKQFNLGRSQDVETWTRYADPPLSEKLESQIDEFSRELEQTVIVSRQEARQRHQRAAWQITVGGGANVDIADLIYLDDKPKITAEIERLVRVFDMEIQSGVKTHLLVMLSRGEGLYQYDAQATQASVEQVESRIRANPPDQAYDVYEGGRRIVRRGSFGEQSQGLTSAELELLRHEHDGYLRAERRNSPWRFWSRIVGRAGILLLVTGMFCLCLGHYRQSVLKSPLRGFSIVAIFLLMLTLNKVLHRLNPYAAVLPVLVATILLTIIYDQRFALMSGVILSILVVLQLRMGSGLLVVLLSAVTVSVFQLREIRTRSKLIVVGSVTAGVVFVGIWVVSFAQSVPWNFALADGLYGVGFALLAGLFIQAGLPLIERLFQIATSLTLLEWCDASKPLLKRLAMEAPGTYNHSLQLGAMCESAAEVIGARGLLARVGAYYHDIGKINKPEYFAENESGAPSKHDKLSPAMSLLIIIGHVKDGLEFARKYALPALLREFIAAHHGTTLVQYFYEEATKQRKSESDRVPDDTEFRYPGPKPRSKEVAILMLADAAETSVRSMTEPTPARIETQVHIMVTRRLMDGQLDHCDLTLTEVHQIEESLVKSLCGIYHARISYPAPPGEKPSPAEKSKGDSDEDKEDHPATPSDPHIS